MTVLNIMLKNGYCLFKRMYLSILQATLGRGIENLEYRFSIGIIKKKDYNYLAYICRHGRGNSA